MFILRPPSAAGIYYNIEKDLLKKEIDASYKSKNFGKTKDKYNAVAAIVPHSEYVVSGPIAASAFYHFDKSNFVVIGPNINKNGADFAVMKTGLWKTPLGEVAIDENFSSVLLERSSLLEYDVIPHQNEHSIEVQLPFLQHKFGNDFKFVPISIKNDFADRNLLDNCKVIGMEIASMIKKQKEKWSVIGTTNFSFGRGSNKDIDKKLISELKKMNVDSFFAKLSESSFGLTGFATAAVTVIVAKELKAKVGELVAYSTSKETAGDETVVTGFASIIFS